MFTTPINCDGKIVLSCEEIQTFQTAILETGDIGLFINWVPRFAISAEKASILGRALLEIAGEVPLDRVTQH